MSQMKSLSAFLCTLAISVQVFSADVLVYDANLNPLVPLMGKGGLVLRNGKRTGRGLLHVASDARSANDSLRATLDFYQKNFGRDGFDGLGTPVEASVNVGSVDLFGMRQNAAWIGDRFRFFIFGKGGGLLGNFSGALDVVAHEFTHAVVDATAKLDPDGEPGALNESLADLMGELVQIEMQGVRSGYEFMIGEDVISNELQDLHRAKTGQELKGLRDMLHPERGLDPQPGHVSQIRLQFKSCTPSSLNDRCGVHELSGIPNRAGALIIQRIGADKAKQLFYRVMTEELRSTSGFADFAAALRRESSLVLGAEASDLVDLSLREVGL